MAERVTLLLNVTVRHLDDPSPLEQKWVFGIHVPTNVLGLEVAHRGQQVRDGGPGVGGSVFSAPCVRLDVWSGVGGGPEGTNIQ